MPTACGVGVGFIRALLANMQYGVVTGTAVALLSAKDLGGSGGSNRALVISPIWFG